MTESLNSIPPESPEATLLPVEVDNSNHETSIMQEEARLLRAAQEAWLERREINPARVPHLIMGRREFDLFRNVPRGYQNYTRHLYEIPQEDQEDCRFALVDIKPGDPTLPSQPELIDVTEAEFGTAVEVEADFLSVAPAPDDPRPPESGGAYRIVDIGDALAASPAELQSCAARLMRGVTADPFSSVHDDIAVRAGGLEAHQGDAYVWTASAFTRSVELTIAFPGKYDSVCVVRGQMREAPNGKAVMAQIVNPKEVIRIEGDNLKGLQKIYHTLYSNPDFMLTEAQRRERDVLFNNYFTQQISREAARNEEQARQEEYDYGSGLRAREIPRE